MGHNCYIVIPLLLVTSAAVLDLSEAACGGGGPRPSCNVDDDCPTGMVCLPMAEEGIRKCWICGCTDRSQCEIMYGRPWCNCSQANDYYGTYCQCPPVESCQDVFSTYGECNTFSDESFELLNNRILNTDEGLQSVFNYFYSNSSGEDACKARCLLNDCHVFSYGGGVCEAFSKSDTMPFSAIVNKISENDNYDIHIRKCVDC